ncbi:MAG TPA: glycosyltransferase family 2 protein [Opitutaceae bacterium]|jgi:rhamnosyltransferase
MSELPTVSIVLRSFNEGWALRETLPALAAQSHRDWELIVFDSGSTDGSIDLLRAAQPRELIQLHPHEYRPGRVLNHGMRLARNDRVIFLNADATPQGPDWLAPLAAGLGDPKVAACFGRQIPRPDCVAPFARDYDRCFGPLRESAAWDHFFSMVSSGLNREPWSRRGFRETMQYSEDDEYTRWCRANGYTIRYLSESVVMHSHNYSPRQAYKRSFGEAWALADVWSGSERSFGPLRTVAAGWVRDALSDLRWCARAGRLAEWPRACRIRWEQRLGRLHGFRAGWRMHRVDAVLS